MKKYLLFLLAISVLAVSGAAAWAGVRYEVRGEQVHRIDGGSDKILEDAEVADTEEWGVIRSFSAFSDGENTGIYFFDVKGKSVSSIPLESEYEFQGLFFAPEGRNLAVMKGSGARPDIEYAIYDVATMKEKASFSGLREEFFWLDAHRAVLTRLEDGVREGGSYYGLAYGLYLSVVVHDIPVGNTIVLKKATETQNFSVATVDTDANVVRIIESSVKSKKDWGDEKKITEKEIAVPLPAAG